MKLNKSKGMSLIELIIYITIFSFIEASIFLYFDYSNREVRNINLEVDNYFESENEK